MPISVQSLASISPSFPTLEKTYFLTAAAFILSLPPSLPLFFLLSLAQSDKHVIVPSTALARWILPSHFVCCHCYYSPNVLESEGTHTFHLVSHSLVQTSPTSHGAPDVRKLQEFELPYVSITSLHSPDYRIVLRKRYKTYFGSNGWAFGPTAKWTIRLPLCSLERKFL